MATNPNGYAMPSMLGGSMNTNCWKVQGERVLFCSGPASGLLMGIERTWSVHGVQNIDQSLFASLTDNPLVFEKWQ